MKKSSLHLFLFLCISLNSIFSQSSTIVNKNIEDKINSYYEVEVPIKRETLKVDNKFNPLTYLASGLLFI